MRYYRRRNSITTGLDYCVYIEPTTTPIARHTFLPTNHILNNMTKLEKKICITELKSRNGGTQVNPQTALSIITHGLSH